MEAKYQLTNESKKIGNRTLYRIKALKRIFNRKDVYPGNLGGFIESEYNLSQEGDCWVGVGGFVFDNAKVLGDGYVDGGGKVFENATVKDNAIVIFDGLVRGNALICDNSMIEGGIIKGHALIKDRSIISNSEIDDYAVISGQSIITRGAIISGYANLHDVVIEKYGAVFGGETLLVDKTVK